MTALPTPRMRDKVILLTGDALCLFVVSLCGAWLSARRWVPLIGAGLWATGEQAYDRVKKLAHAPSHKECISPYYEPPSRSRHLGG